MTSLARPLSRASSACADGSHAAHLAFCVLAGYLMRPIVSRFKPRFRGSTFLFEMGPGCLLQGERCLCPCAARGHTRPRGSRALACRLARHARVCMICMMKMK
jgi:hypothetical protein